MSTKPTVPNDCRTEPRFATVGHARLFEKMTVEQFDAAMRGEIDPKQLGDELLGKGGKQ